MQVKEKTLDEQDVAYKPGSNAARLVRYAAYVAIPVALFYALFAYSGATVGIIGTTLVDAPFWMWTGVFGTVTVMQVIGAWKWIAIRQWISPMAQTVSPSTAIELTVLGSMLAHVLPPQASHVIVRWYFVRKDDQGEKGVVASTLFEHVYELFVYMAAAILAILFYLLDIQITVLALATSVVLVVFFRGILSVSVAIASKAEKHFPNLQILSSASDAMVRAATMPPRLTAVVVATTIALFFGRCLTIALIAGALAPSIDLLIVVAGFPGVAFLSSLPITSAGLGIAEWSWSAVLVAAGATTALSAVIAVAFRLINLICLFALSATLRIWIFVLGLAR